MSSFRITTNGMFRNYRSNLYKNNKKLQDAMIGVETERKFTAYAEDPAAASKAWRLRRSYWLNEDQIDNTNHVISKFESASQAMHAIVDGDAGNDQYGLNGILSAIRGLNDPAGSARNALGKEMIQTSENIISVMNSKYGDDFIFAGADGANIPFKWEGDRLLYRGVNVNREKPAALEDFDLTEADLQGVKSTDFDMSEPNPSNYAGGASDPGYIAAKEKYDTVQELTTRPSLTDVDDEGNPKYTGEDDPNYKTAVALYENVQKFRTYAEKYGEDNGISYERGVEEYEKLEKMANETTYVDIGLGMQEDSDGHLIEGSAFNSAVSGLKFLGYGKDNNLASIVRELGQLFVDADPETGAFGSPDIEQRANELLTKLQASVGAAQDQHIQLEADAKYLKTNLTQLNTNKDQLNTQINDTERMDMAEAITEMTWAQYCYNAALRIGNSILSQSLIDYMS